MVSPSPLFALPMATAKSQGSGAVQSAVVDAPGAVYKTCARAVVAVMPSSSITNSPSRSSVFVILPMFTGTSSFVIGIERTRPASQGRKAGTIGQAPYGQPAPFWLVVEKTHRIPLRQGVSFPLNDPSGSATSLLPEFPSGTNSF